MASRMLPMVQLYTFLVRTLADGDILVTTSSSDVSYVIETICTQCSCPTATNPGWRGHQSLESCAQTCAQEGSWIKHASGLKSNGSPGDNNCGCCSSLETIDQPADYGINVYQVSDSTVTTSHAQPPSSYVIQVVCTQCSCLTAPTPGWRGHQSLESCAQTCAREGSWFKHASGVKLDGSQGDNNCNCCDTVEVIFGDGGGVNVYEFRDVDADYYFRVSCGPNCSCTESTKARTASKTFGDCAAFCAAEQFPRFQYDDTVNEGTCSCCISQGDERSGGGSVYAFDSSRVTEAGAAHRSAAIMVACLLFFAFQHCGEVHPQSFTMFHA